MPEWRGELRQRLAVLGLTPLREAEIIEELSLHLEDRFRELRSRGMADDAAFRAALEEIGEGADLAQALAALERPASPPAILPGEQRGGGWGSRLAQDLRFGIRVLRTRPAFTAVAVLTLGLGIGANTAIFSTVNGVLLKPLPYPESQNLVTFWGTAPEKRLPVVNYPDAMFVFFHQRTRVFEKVAAYSTGSVSLSGDGEPERVTGTWVSSDFFAVMRQVPIAGRAFLPEDATRGKSDVVVLSHALWRRRFGGDRSLVGKSILIGGQPTVVIGVMPQGFGFPDDSELWLPQVLDPQSLNNWYLSTVARLKPGRGVADAHREVVALSDEFMLGRLAQFPDAKPGGARAVVQPVLSSLVGDARTPLLVLLGAVGCVLLIASANIGNLLLARALARSREMALRCCLGASAGRLAAQLLTESLVLALLGGAAGLLFGVLGIRAIQGLELGPVPRLAEIRLDPLALLFTLGVTLAAGVLFGLAPAIRASRVDPATGLHEGARSGTSGGARRLSHGFVVAQLALSLVLLIGAGLLLRSFRRTLAVDPGFRPEHVLTARVQLPWPKYGSDTVVRIFQSRLLESVRGLPGVQHAGLANRIPFSRGNPQQNLFVEGQPPRSGEAVPVINSRVASVGYFEAIGTPILQGRDFLPSDDPGDPPVVIVDETVARQYWPGGDPIGKRIRTSTDSGTPWLTIVGVAANVKHGSLRERPDFELYRALSQSPTWSSYVVIRTTGDSESLIAGLRRRVAELDPIIPVAEVSTLEGAMAKSLSILRLTNLLLSAFAGLALLLAVIGIYGVMSLNVNGRIGEFGVRLALGAAPRDVLRLVMGQGILLAVLGLLIGLVGALWVTRFLGSLLFEVSPVDPITFGSVAAALMGAAILACYLPARRATKADPIAVLRRD
ncbi:MAG TPA: ABC transporter permease [Gemmatimonadales bacterium]|jgi:putative ABC transport system permease protein|nr:ABC transporter permease [Gemmatimonadales bacterium]